MAAIDVSHANRLVLRVVSDQMRKPNAETASNTAATTTTTRRKEPGSRSEDGSLRSANLKPSQRDAAL